MDWRGRTFQTWRVEDETSTPRVGLARQDPACVYSYGTTVVHREVKIPTFESTVYRVEHWRRIYLLSPPSLDNLGAFDNT